MMGGVALVHGSGLGLGTEPATVDCSMVDQPLSANHGDQIGSTADSRELLSLLAAHPSRFLPVLIRRDMVFKKVV